MNKCTRENKGTSWKRPPDHPRKTWIFQIPDDTGMSPPIYWDASIRRGHERGTLWSQKTVSWWWRWHSQVDHKHHNATTASYSLLLLTMIIIPRNYWLLLLLKSCSKHTHYTIFVSSYVKPLDFRLLFNWPNFREFNPGRSEWIPTGVERRSC